MAYDTVAHSLTDKKHYYSMTDQPQKGTLIDDWRRELKKQFTGKQRGDIPRAKMSELPGDRKAHV